MDIYAAFEASGIGCTREQAGLLALTAERLVETNRRFNLTAITEPEEILRRHFLDSASLLLAEQIPAGSRLLDVGTGAGFPGVPLHILRPDIDVTLLDSTGKKINYVSALLDEIRSLSPAHKNARTICSRAEDAARSPRLRESFDFVVTRAVADLPVLCEICLPFLRVGGSLTAYRTADLDLDLAPVTRTAGILGGKISAHFYYNIEPNVSTIPQELAESGCRVLIKIDKFSETPQKYPRTYNQILNSPI